MLRLPILILQCPKVSRVEREACQIGSKLSFFEGVRVMKLAEIFLRGSLGLQFQGVPQLPDPSWICKHTENPCLQGQAAEVP